MSLNGLLFANVALRLMMSSSSLAATEGIVLKVIPSKTQFLSGEPLELLITVENTHATHAWYIVPRLVVGVKDEGAEPHLTLRVFDSQGKEIPSTAPRDIMKRVPSSVCDLTELGPRALFGRRVVLGDPPFGFALTTPGGYEVRASIEVTVAGRLKGSRGVGKLDEERMFSGVVEASPVVVNVK
jgi:hypothetical protein